MLIRLSMATTLDGKIAAADREAVRLGSGADIGRLDELRSWADVLVVGAGTVRAWDPPMELKDAEASRTRLSDGRPEHPAVVVISGSLNVPVGRAFASPGRKLVVTTEEAGEPSPELAAAAEIWRLGGGRVDIPALVDRLERERLERILIEGGGKTAAGFFEHDMVDELFITVTRWVIGGDGAPTIADAERVFEPPPLYDLVELDTTAEEIFLQYRKRKDAI